MRRTLMSMVLGLSIVACSSEPPAPVIQEVDFPELDPTTLAIYCIRGALAPTTSATGLISFTRSCPRLEAWRVRVSRPTQVRFEVMSAFNSGLGLFEIPDVDNYNPGDPLAQDSESGSNRDALIDYPLEPDTEYAIVVVGSGADDTGPYTLAVTALD